MGTESVDTNTGVVTDVVAAQTWTPEQMQLIRDTVAKGANDDEFKLFIYVCRRRGLDPLAKQIYWVMRWDPTLKRMAGVAQTGIDGFRVIAERSGGYAGQDAPQYAFSADGQRLVSATVTVYRIIANGIRVGFTAMAFYDEYIQTKKDGSPNSMWVKMPRGQLAKCAESLALRKAFPDDLSGIYTEDEMGQASNEPLPPSRQVSHANYAAPPPEKNGIAKLMGLDKEVLIERIVKGLAYCFPSEDTTDADAFINNHLDAKTIRSTTWPENTKGELAQFLKALMVLVRDQQAKAQEDE